MKTINSQICAVDSRRCDYRRSPKIKVLNPALRTFKSKAKGLQTLTVHPEK